MEPTVLTSLPTVATVLGAAAIDSINPCAIGVLILMISVMLSQKHSVRRMLLLGGFYILAIFLTYLAAGLGLLYGLARVPLYVAEYVSIAVGVFIIFAGLIEIKDFFWYGRWFSLGIPVSISKRLHNMTQNATASLLGVSLLGAFVAAVELPCTGAPYLAIITLLSQNFDFSAFLLLVLYNVVFVVPLLVILLMVASGFELYKVQKFRMEGRGFMRLLIGMLLVFLGWLLMLIANGTINLG
ncbi:MAG: cytochrome c biogenesis protein, transmembrane region [candidate division WWE3 bacterium CSP1-7]|jgi:cytochrome c biogenesis protein CcdA|uniref:Cytochrome c biogenesis protein, transmembrane region n=1 Tax=candidate division WWE3 bacterium CSP1-7 TaxID=1576480 RepID=A0A0T5ZX39_UNCKA|nr:MAG: cytochrome c biogenesis protein, transmembrane region [candidate division WWE3 bacterium CSP1-7]